VVWRKLGGGLGLLVYTVVHESNGELRDHGDYDEEAENLVDGVPTL